MTIPRLASGGTMKITFTGVAVATGKFKSVARVSHLGVDPVGSNDTAKKTVTATGHAYATDVDCAIPDNNATGVDCPLSVTDGGTVQFVAVSLRINHTFDGDLQISLVTPDSTTISLVTRRGGSGDNFGTGPNPCDSSTVDGLADFSTTPISAGAPPYAGTFAPEVALSGLNGHGRAGTWSLHVADLAASDMGTVLCWSLVTD